MQVKLAEDQNNFKESVTRNREELMVDLIFFFMPSFTSLSLLKVLSGTENSLKSQMQSHFQKVRDARVMLGVT
jgi:hypothetical protein